MSPEELENWAKIKRHLEECGVTDNHFYRRACMILSGRPDPLDLPNLGDTRETEG